MKYDAYWISPDGKIAPAEGGAVSHINMIFQKPEFFGYTKDELEKLHKRSTSPGLPVIQRLGRSIPTPCSGGPRSAVPCTRGPPSGRPCP